MSGRQKTEKTERADKRDSKPPVKDRDKPAPEGLLVSKEKINEQLLDAAFIDDFEMLKMLVEISGVDVNVKDEVGYTPLMRVAECGNVEAAELLLDKGADPNCADEYGVTVLMIAAAYNELELVKLLEARGVDINAVDDSDMNALDYAIKNKNQEIVEFLKEKGVWE